MLDVMDAPLVSVIVPTRARPAAVTACLSALRSLEYPNFEIIVVDNASPNSADPRVRIPLWKELSRVRWLREDMKGSSNARNRGLAEAYGQFVAFVDDDVVVDKYWLAELVRAFGTGDNVAAVTGLVIPLQLETPAQLWFELYGGFGKGPVRRLFDMGVNRPENPLFPYAAAMFGSGNNMAFKTSVLRQLGGFDPILGAGAPGRGGEDLALFYRVVVHGYALLYEPAAIVHHAHRRTYTELRDQIYTYGVGFTAYLTSVAIREPMMLPRLAVALPAALAYFLRSRSSNSKKREASYPKVLTCIELLGMLYGPIAYMRAYFFLKGRS